MHLDRDECIPCILAQIERLTAELRLSPERRGALRAIAAKTAASLDPAGLTAPEFSALLYRRVTDDVGVSDPYQQIKRQQNATARNHLPRFRARIAAAADPLAAAIQLALLGNLIDLGNSRVIDASPLTGSAEIEPAAVNAAIALQQRLTEAASLLYIGDNAGEAVLDALLIAELRRVQPRLRVFFAVRGGPAINDVLEDDARDAGLGEVAEIVSSGCALAGTLPSLATPRFRELYGRADIVIAKGQGNFETLEGEAREILFLFKVKCAVVARYTGWALGTSVAAWGPAPANRQQAESR